jgi:hypothetical protein
MQDEKRRVLKQAGKNTSKPNQRFSRKHHYFLSRFFSFAHQNNEKQGKKIRRCYRVKILLYIHFQKAERTFLPSKRKIKQTDVFQKKEL